MLQRLHVSNYVLIDSLDIDFPEGLIIITGQTGAGKSILLGALSLLMGARADAGMIKDGADNCVVEGEFETSDPVIRALLDENDVDWEDGHLIIRRLVNPSGRSRAFVNDSPVSVGILQNLSSRLVDIHSQHQTLLLSDRQFQLSVLDHYAGNGELLAECGKAWKQVQDLKSEISSVDEQIARSERDRDYNEAQFRQLEAASLKEGELSELEEEQRQLANAEEIKTCLCTAESAFDQNSSEGGTSVDSSLKEAVRQLSKAGRFIPDATLLSERLDSCRLELEDILSEISAINSSVNLSQTRLEEVENRMSLIYGLMHKHSCASESELISLRDKLSMTICDSTLLLEKRKSLDLALDSAREHYSKIADSLHKSREAAIKSLSGSIQESVRSLELPYAVFEAVISEAAPGASGTDQVTFLFSANGTAPADVAKCASGGELSRIMLSLKAMMATFTQMPTLIFDEIDTGVSGSVADKIGSMICQMGQSMQVFAITHLPQVAAKGKAHYLVSKDMNPQTGKAVSSISRLGERERVLELARMLSGSTLTEAAIANAESLLKGC